MRGEDTVEAFELLRFAAVAAGFDAVLLELEGRWPGGAPAPGRARLTVETRHGPHDLAPASDREDDGVWRGTFAVPFEAVAGPLAVSAHGLVVELPAPDAVDETIDRLALLAREGNRLRRRLERAEATAATALAVAAERDRVIAQRDALQRDLDTATAEVVRLRQEVDAADRRAADERAVLEGQWGHELERRQHELAAATAAAEQERAQAAQREAALQRELDATAQELQRLREEAERVQGERDALQADRDALQAELEADDESETEADALRRERDGLRAALDATRGELAGEREHLTALRADYARLREQLEQVRAQLRDAEPDDGEIDDTDADEVEAGADGAPRAEDEAPTRVGARLWNDRGGERADAPTQRSARASSPSRIRGQDDEDTFETQPITPPERSAGATRLGEPPATSGELARYIAVAVLALALVIVVLLVAGLR